MRFLLTIAFFICCSLTTTAQQTFEKVIDTLSISDARCVQPTFDGGYIVCGTSYLIDNDVGLIKLDSTGKVQWAKIYYRPGWEYGRYIEQLPDSGYILQANVNPGSQSKGMLMRFNQFGDTLWTKLISAGSEGTNFGFGNSMATIDYSLFGSAGDYEFTSGDPPNALFIATIGNGFPLAIKTYNPTIFGADSKGIDKTFGNGFVLAGGIGTSVSSGDVYLIRVNAIGDTLWTKSYGKYQTDFAFDVKQTTDSGFIIAAITFDTTVFKYNIFLIKTNAVGDTIWTKQYFSPIAHEAYSVSQTSDNGYIVCGLVVGGLYLLKTNSDGDTLWSRVFAISTACAGYFVRQTKDHGYIISGISQMTPGGAYIIKTDSMGLVHAPNEITTVEDASGFVVYPNPSSGVFTLKCSDASFHKTMVKVYNAAAQCIYSIRMNEETELPIDLSQQPNGMYLLQIHVGNNTFSKTLIISKQ